MRRVALGNPPIGGRDDRAYRKWIEDSFRELERATNEEQLQSVANDFSIENYTETRTLDMATATATDIGNFIATLVSDLRRGGSKRTQ